MLRKPCLLLMTIQSSLVHAGPAIGQFEMKDLEVEPDTFEFQSQNAHSFGQPSRQFIDDEDEIEYDDNEYIQQRHALEIEYSPTDYLRSRIGVEFEKERFDRPASVASADAFDQLQLTEFAFETVFVALPPTPNRPGIGFLTEFEFPLQTGENGKSVVFGPIFQYGMAPWQVLTNLYTIYHYDGEDDGKWDFSYTAQLLYQVSEHWSLALEAYGTLDHIANSARLSEEQQLLGTHDQHRLGPIVYWTIEDLWDPRSAWSPDNQSAAPESSLNIGIGWFFGVNDNTPDHTLKWSLEYDF